MKWILPIATAVVLSAIFASGLFRTAAICGAGDAPLLSGFVDRVDASVRGREAELRARNLEHYALLRPVEAADIERWLAPISARRDGGAIVLAVGDTPELHGGAILDFLFRYWRPQERIARPNDRFAFLNGEVSLGNIYAGHRLQIFLPDAGRSNETIGGESPGSPTLARIRFFTDTEGVPVVERDAYSFLHLLVAREDDFTATWTNRLGQELSVDRLMQEAWGHYLQGGSDEAERDDHSNLHLVELLLAYRYRAETRSDDSGDLDPNEIKRSFLSDELVRSMAGADDESIAHYTESLGWILAEPDVSFSEGEKQQLRDWLSWLERERFRDLDGVEAPHLAHLLNGLQLLSAHPERLASR